VNSVPSSVARVLDRSTEQRPDAEAVVARGGSLTYRQLDHHADAAAGGLWELGVRPGDRVAVTLPNDLAVVIAFHAVMRLGAIWVGIPEALAAPEKTRLLQHCRPRIYLCDSAAAEQSGRNGTPVPPVLLVETGRPDGEWAALLTAGHRAPTVHIDPHAPAGIAYTSGTTGAPKGVVHSQHNLVLPGAVLAATRSYGPDLRKGDCLPLTILNLMVLTTVLTSQTGGCCVVMDRRDVHGVVEWIRAERLTVWNGVPTQLRDLLHRTDVTRSDLVSLDEVWCGGADLPDSLRTDFQAKFGLAVRATYGLTEAPTVVAMDPPGDQWKPGSSGIALPHLDVRVDDGELIVGAATTGGWAQRYTPMLGQWIGDSVVATDPVLRTGDLGSVDADGWVRVTDRRKLLIVRGGANVYPTEVEHVVKTAAGVRDVAVFGRPDDRLGERVTAIVEADPAVGPALTADGLRAHCEGELAAYKIPDSWVVIATLPRNAMGKIDRTQLPALFASATRLDVRTHA
jgi:long-chain acyl-CoA synthetase